MTDSARKQELLERSWEYVLAHGFADLSLRPLAGAIGSSPRVLIYLFDSKDGLVRALLRRSRDEQLDLLASLEAAGAVGLADIGAQVWAWLAATEHRALLRLWLEAYSRSVDLTPGGPAEPGATPCDAGAGDAAVAAGDAGGRSGAALGTENGVATTPGNGADPGVWTGFAASTVTDWLDLLAAAAPEPAERTLLLAVLRGCLLDLLATGDRERIDAAVATHLGRLAH